MPREGSVARPFASLMGFCAERGIDHDGDGEEHYGDKKIKKLHRY